jgi:hypothetical protein
MSASNRTYTAWNFAHESEQEVFGQIEHLDITELNLWPTLEGGNLKETDIFMVHTDLGAFIAEIKSHSIDKVQKFGYNSWTTRNDGVKPSPLKQAEQCMHRVQNMLFEHHVRDLWITTTVIWSGIDRGEWLAHFVGNPRAEAMADEMIFRDECLAGVDVFVDALLRVRTSRVKDDRANPTRVSDDTLKQLIQIFGDPQPPILSNIDRRRLEFFEETYGSQAQRHLPIGSNKRISLHGAPGTGKTWALLAIARQHAEAEKRVLFLCYNRVLCADIRRMVRGMKNSHLDQYLTINTIFEFLTRFNDHVGLPFPKSKFDHDTWAELVANEMSEFADDQDIYDLILVDEAQDMLDYIEPALNSCISSEGSIVIGLGIGQELYNKKKPVTWLERFPGEDVPILCQNVYRSPAKSFVVAQAIRESNISEYKITSDIREIALGRCKSPNGRVTLRDAYGAGPKFFSLAVPRKGVLRSDHYVKVLTQFLRGRRDSLQKGETLSDILFLIPSRSSEYIEWLNVALTNCNIASHNYINDVNRDTVAADNQVRICTFHSARGIEAKIVVLLDLNTLDEANRDLGTTENLLYIALTRSLRETYIVELDGVESASGKMLKQINAEVTKLFASEISKHWFKHAQMDEVVTWTKERYGHDYDDQNSIDNAIDFDSDVPAQEPHVPESTSEVTAIQVQETGGSELSRWIKVWLTPLTRKWMRGSELESTDDGN